MRICLKFLDKKNLSLNGKGQGEGEAIGGRRNKMLSKENPEELTEGR
jgi:hypothetical protein